MLKDILNEVVGVVVGKQAEGIVDLLFGNSYVNEFVIAKKLNITINQARNILYKLADYGLVSSIRKKDKKKGWYTYFWKIEVLKSLDFLKVALEKNIANVTNHIKDRESKQFYVCQRCNVEFSEENALLRDFTCQECGDIFQLKDNSKVLKEMKKNLDKLNNELKMINEEINSEKEKEGKKRSSEMKKEENKKAKERAEKREKAKKLRKRLANKETKAKNKKSKKIIKKQKPKALKKKKHSKK